MDKLDITRYIHESNLIEGYDDVTFDNQSMIAWEYLIQQPIIGEHCIKKVQKIITLSQTNLQPDWRGYYRKIGVSVGIRACPPPDKVGRLVKHWLKIYETAEPKEAHIRFELIHPFVDGNGRTGRMLMWWQEIKLGQKPTLILNSEKSSYYNWFR